jgi:hypothetical protein
MDQIPRKSLQIHERGVYYRCDTGVLCKPIGITGITGNIVPFYCGLQGGLIIMSKIDELRKRKSRKTILLEPFIPTANSEQREYAPAVSRAVTERKLGKIRESMIALVMATTAATRVTSKILEEVERRIDSVDMDTVNDKQLYSDLQAAWKSQETFVGASKVFVNIAAAAPDIMDDIGDDESQSEEERLIEIRRKNKLLIMGGDIDRTP